MKKTTGALPNSTKADYTVEIISTNDQPIKELLKETILKSASQKYSLSDNHNCLR